MRTKSSSPAPSISPAEPVVHIAGAGSQLRVGFIALTDAAPLIVAHTEGIFRRHGLSVRLTKEVGWATIRDKMIYRELDAAQAVAPMVAATTVGVGCLATPCVTACTLSTHGDAITLSAALWARGVRDAATLREEIMRTRHERLLVLGVVFAASVQNILLRDWLRSAGIDPLRDVRIVVVPPAQLHRNLAAGTLDGYCVGEPWNTLAVREKTGWIAATSGEIAPGHAEKVLMVREDFAVARSEEHLAMVAAVVEAAKLCDEPEFRPELVKILSRSEFLDLPAKILAPALVGPLPLGADKGSVDAGDYIRFHAQDANSPAPARAQWIVDGLVRHGLIPREINVPTDLVRRVFRADLYSQAKARFSEAGVHAL